MLLQTSLLGAVALLLAGALNRDLIAGVLLRLLGKIMFHYAKLWRHSHSVDVSLSLSDEFLNHMSRRAVLVLNREFGRRLDPQVILQLYRLFKVGNFIHHVRRQDQLYPRDLLDRDARRLRRETGRLRKPIHLLSQLWLGGRRDEPPARPLRFVFWQALHFLHHFIDHLYSLLALGSIWAKQA